MAVGTYFYKVVKRLTTYRVCIHSNSILKRPLTCISILDSYTVERAASSHQPRDRASRDSQCHIDHPDRDRIADGAWRFEQLVLYTVNFVETGIVHLYGVGVE
jgi:hypothetical protein